MSAVPSERRRSGRSKPKHIHWYKAVHGLQNDLRYPAVAKRAEASILEVIAIVNMLFECASRNHDRGSISNFDAESFAAYAGTDQAKIEAVVAALGDKGFILNGRLVDWARTQGENIVEISTSPGAIRTRRYRARQRANARQLEMVFVFTGAAKPAEEPELIAAVAPRSPPRERVTPPSHHITRASHARTEGRAKEDSQDFQKRESLGRDAPSDAGPTERRTNVQRLKRRSAGPPKSPGLKANIKEQLRQKHGRFLIATGGDSTTYWLVMMNADEQTKQRLFEEVDARMRAQNWDDMREWKRWNLREAA